MLVGGILGILFVTILRRVMVEDMELPFPESVAAAEIHKAGQGGQTGAKFLFCAMGLGALIQALGQLNVFASSWEKFISFAGKKITLGNGASVQAGGGALLSSPGREPRLHGRRLHHRAQARVAELHRRPAGLGPLRAAAHCTSSARARCLAAGHGRGPSPRTTPGSTMANQVWRCIVRPIAIGGMLMSAAFTLYRMRKSLGSGLARAIGDVKKAAAGEARRDAHRPGPAASTGCSSASCSPRSRPSSSTSTSRSTSRRRWWPRS